MAAHATAANLLGSRARAAAAPQQPQLERRAAAAPQQSQPKRPQQTVLHARRRRVLTALPATLLGMAAARAVGLPLPAAAAAPEPAAAADGVLRPDSLAARIATTGTVRQPGLMPPWADKQIYHPRWLFGEWEVELTFEGLSLPQGRELVPDGFLQAADAPDGAGGGARLAYRQRWYSTLPDTLDNRLRVELGLGMPRDAIIADRAFNTAQATNAFLGWGAVERVAYDPREAPLRATAELSRVAPDGSALPPRRLEIYINALSSEEAASDAAAGAGEAGGHPAFYASELCRQVLVGVRQAEVRDYELMHEWRLLEPGLVAGRRRACLYLQPQDARYFAAGGRAVAVYDWALSMRRLPAPADAPLGAVACVPTPKDVVQCV